MKKHENYDSKTIVTFVIIFFVAYTFWFIFTNYNESVKIREKRFNIILISTTALRKDHMSVYGYSMDTTPNLKNFSGDSIVFENAFSQSTWTLPSQASVFTSQYSDVNGVIDRDQTKNFTKPTLEILKDKGYKIAGFVGGFVDEGDLSSSYGFSRGFQTYEDNNGFLLNVTVPLALNWIKQNKDNNFFLLIHGYDSHGPYHKPEPFEHFFDPYYNGTIANHTKFYLDYNTERHPNSILHLITKINNSIILNYTGGPIELTQQDMDHIIAHYDEGILHADYYVGIFLNSLKKMNLYNDTVIIFYSDHGENLGDHLQENSRVIAHSHPYEEVVHVPLIIKHPDYDPGRISQKAQLIDIMPTILDFLSIKIPPELQGKSLVPVIEKNEDVNEYVYGLGIDNMKYIRSDSWKLIMRNTFGEGRVELYNIEEDSKESHNLLYNYPEIAKKLEEKISEWDIMNYYKRVRVNQK